MGPYIISLFALAGVSAWLALHHGWLALRRRDLPEHGAFALLAAAVAGIGFSDGVTASCLDLATMRGSAVAQWASLLVAQAALIHFVHRFTRVGPAWAPRLLLLGSAALAALWLAKPHGFWSGPLRWDGTLASLWWGERLPVLAVSTDWSYLLMCAQAALALGWCLGAAAAAWRRTRRGRHLALALALVGVLAAAANGIASDIGGHFSPAFITHSNLALALVMSWVLSSEVVRARQLERRLRQAERFEALGRLAGGVAHDFNNLLTGVNGAAELLQPRLAGDAENAQLLDIILRSGARGTELTRQMLAFAAGTSAPLGCIDVHQAVREVAALTASRRIAVQLDLAAPHHHLRCEPARLTSLLLNLCVNARDAMAEGGTLAIATACREPPPELRLRHRPGPGQLLEIAIADTGCGIPAAVLERIWEPLFTTKGAAGTGLGMVQVDEALVALGGAAHVASTPGRGTLFRLWLPLARGSSRQRTRPVGAPQPVLVACRDRALSELRAADLATHGPWPVEAYDAEDSSIHQGLAMVAEAALAERCRARHPGLPLVVLGDPPAAIAGAVVLPASSDGPAIARALHDLMAAED